MEEYVIKLLPQTSFRVVIVNVEDINDDESKFSLTLRLKIRSKEEFAEWLKEHQRLSACTYRVLKTKPCDGKYVIYKAFFRCHRNTHPSAHKVKKPSAKHTDCPATLSVTIKAVSARSRSVDEFLPDFPCVVNIDSCHNHQIRCAAALSFRDPDPSIKDKFIALFKAGYSPAQAMEAHKHDLMGIYGDNFDAACTDRAICPNLKWAHNLCRNGVWREKSIGNTADDDMLITGELHMTVDDISAAGSAYDKDDVKQVLVGVVETLMKFYDSDPLEFGKAVHAVHETALSLNTTASVINALHNFGKEPSMSELSSFHEHSRAALVPVQPLDKISSMKSQSGGQRCAIPCRLLKRSFVDEHGYGRPKRLSDVAASSFELPHEEVDKTRFLVDCAAPDISLAQNCYAE